MPPSMPFARVLHPSKFTITSKVTFFHFFSSSDLTFPFSEKKSFKPEFGAEQIFTGPLLGVRGGDSLAFYDWDDAKLVRRIELECDQVDNKYKVYKVIIA